MIDQFKPHAAVVSVTISLKSRTDLNSLLQYLKDLAQQDSRLVVQADPTTEQISLKGMSESHLEMTCERIVKERQIQIVVSAPNVIYAETIRKYAEAEGKFIRQTGTRGQYGHVKVWLEQRELGSGYLFHNQTTEDVIPTQFVEAINLGIQGALRGGILIGCELVDIRAVLFGGSYHEQDSSEMAFQIAASIALKEAAKKASPVALEPIMSVEVTIPLNQVALILSDLRLRKGEVQGMTRSGDRNTVKATAPLAELLGYERCVREFAPGTSSCSIEFSDYAPMPDRGHELGRTVIAR